MYITTQAGSEARQIPWVTRPSICHSIVSNLKNLSLYKQFVEGGEYAHFFFWVWGRGGGGIRHCWFLNSTCIHHEVSRHKHVQVWTKHWGDTNKNISKNLHYWWRDGEELKIRKNKRKKLGEYMTYDSTTVCFSLGIASWKYFEVHS